jgi:hypothetical protein
MASSPLKRRRQYAFTPDALGKRHPMPMMATGNWRGILLYFVGFNDKLLAATTSQEGYAADDSILVKENLNF